MTTVRDGQRGHLCNHYAKDAVPVDPGYRIRTEKPLNSNFTGLNVNNDAGRRSTEGFGVSEVGIPPTLCRGLGRLMVTVGDIL